MRSTQELIVDQAELAQAAAALARWWRRAEIKSSIVLSRPDGSDLVLSLLLADARLPAAGTWRQAVETDAPTLAGIALRLPPGPLRLLYVAGQLIIGPTSISALLIAEDPAAAFEVEPAAGGEQLVIPGAGRISPRALVERRRAEPLRGRRGQKPPPAGLFSVNPVGPGMDPAS